MVPPPDPRELHFVWMNLTLAPALAARLARTEIEGVVVGAVALNLRVSATGLDAPGAISRGALPPCVVDFLSPTENHNNDVALTVLDTIGFVDRNGGTIGLSADATLKHVGHLAMPPARGAVRWVSYDRPGHRERFRGGQRPRPPPVPGIQLLPAQSNGADAARADWPVVHQECLRHRQRRLCVRPAGRKLRARPHPVRRVRGRVSVQHEPDSEPVPAARGGHPQHGRLDHRWGLTSTRARPVSVPTRTPATWISTIFSECRRRCSTRRPPTIDTSWKGSTSSTTTSISSTNMRHSEVTPTPGAGADWSFPPVAGWAGGTPVSTDDSILKEFVPLDTSTSVRVRQDTGEGIVELAFAATDAGGGTFHYENRVDETTTSTGRSTPSRSRFRWA